VTESQPKIRASAADLEALVDRTAEALGIDAAFVEKDFWVIEALRIATATAASHEVRAIFKGGTSLSRAFGIIQRFSEDVDLLLDFPDGMPKGARDRTIKAIGEDVRLHFGIAPEKVREDSASTGVKRNFRLNYPNAKSADAITEGIYLEIGSRGGPTPSRDVSIRSMIANHALQNMGLAESEYEEFAPVLAHVLAPERTLIEKMALLAAAGDKFDGGEKDALAKHGRHVYDVARLLESIDVTQALTDLGPIGIAELAADIHARSELAQWHSVPQTDAGYLSYPVFHDATGANGALRAAYEPAKQLIFGPRPTFEECMAVIAGAAHHL
jgi:hypothetical protein